MSELRRGVIRAGDCVEGEAALFAELDANRAQPEQAREAIAVCRDCRRLPKCDERLGHISMALMERGARNTVIAGTYVKSELPVTTLPERRRRIYAPDDGTALGYREFRPTPEWFLDEFAAAHAIGHGYLKPVRELVRQEPHAFTAAGLAKRREPVLSWLRDQPFATRTELGSAGVSDALSSIATVFVRTRDSFRIRQHPGLSPDSELAALQGLAEEYLETAGAIHRLGLRTPGRLAQRHDINYCNAVFERFAERPEVSTAFIRRAFECHSDPMALLERYTGWLGEAVQAHRNNSAFTIGTLQTVVFRAARHEDKAKLSEFIDNYLARYGRVQMLSVHLPFVRDHHIRQLAREYSNPEQAVQALQDSVEAFNQLASRYRIPRRHLYAMAFAYRTNLEGRAQRYRDNVDRLTLQFGNHPDFTVESIQHFAAHTAHDPMGAAQGYVQNLASLRREFASDPAIDDDALKGIARLHTRNPSEGARTYIAVYRRLRQQYEFDDVIEDWMLREAATRGPRNAEVGLKFLKSAMRKGLLKVSLSTPIRDDSGILLADTASISESSPGPEDRYILKEALAERRVEIGAALLVLSKSEREAVIYAFGLDWLLPDVMADRNTIIEELGISESAFEGYVKNNILPKLRTVFG